MPDYQKGKIYKLVSDHTDEIYIGSTIQKLSQRLTKHVSDFRKGRNKCTSKKLFELGKVKIILIENVPCNSKEELLKHERNYIETMVCVNKVIPGRTDAEYYHDNKDKHKEYMKEYCLKNKDKIKEYKKEYCLKNNDKIKESKKEHYHKNKDKIKEKLKEYRLNNKDKLKEYNKVKITCDCGVDVNKNHILRHKKTKKHFDLMESKTEVPTL